MEGGRYFRTGAYEKENVKELKDRNDKNVKLFLYKIYKNLDGKAESSCLI